MKKLSKYKIKKYFITKLYEAFTSNKIDDCLFSYRNFFNQLTREMSYINLLKPVGSRPPQVFLPKKDFYKGIYNKKLIFT